MNEHLQDLRAGGRPKRKWEIELEEKDKEIERLNNIIYTTLEYVDREEINSTGKPYIYTERGKHIKELLEGERTFNSLWQENNRLNNIINELEKYIEDTKQDGYKLVWINEYKNYFEAGIEEILGSDKE